MTKRIAYLVVALLLLTGLIGPVIYADKLANNDEPVKSMELNTGQDPPASGSPGKETGQLPGNNSHNRGNSVSIVNKKTSAQQVTLNTSAENKTNDAKLSSQVNSNVIDLWVTKDFAHSIIYAQKVSFRDGDSVLDVLNKYLDVETAHGGGFVNSINGLASGYTNKSGQERQKKDWFYWINGIMAPVGADQYRVKKGDLVWWDYHDWGTTMFIPAVIGSYPEPFRHGYGGKSRGATILYAPGFEQQAREIKGSLENFQVEPVSMESFCEEKVAKRSRPTIVIATWSAIKDSSTINDLNQRGAKIGFYIRFLDSGFELLDATGKTAKTCGAGCGAVVAVGSGTGDVNPLWLVIGVDSQGLASAVKVLQEKSKEIEQCFGVAVDSGKVIALPVQ